MMHCGGIGVEMLLARECGGEIVLVEAAKQGWGYHSHIATKSDTD